MSILPSQKFIITVLIAILIGSAGYAYKLYSDSRDQKETDEIFKEATGKLEIVLNNDSIKNTDTDNDGIPDVEENLLGLDPNTDSTEEKKILDKNKEEKESLYGDQLTLLSSKPETKSDTFIKELYTASLNEKLSDVDLKNSTTERLKNTIERGSIQESNLKSLKTGANSDLYNTYIKKYIQYIVINETDLIVLNSAFSTSGTIDSRTLYKFKNKITAGKEFLLELSYPENIKPFYVNHINTLIYIENIATSLINHEKDPIISYSGLTQLKPALSELTQQYEQFTK